MKLKKILATTAASVIAVSALAANSSANIYVPEEKEATLDDMASSNWLITLYRTGDDKRPDIDFGIDLTKVRDITFYGEIVVGAKGEEKGLTLEDFDFTTMDDKFGGACITSANGGTIGSKDKNEDGTDNELYKKYNWNNSATDGSDQSTDEWWGFPLPGDSAEGSSDLGDGTNQSGASYTKSNIMKYLNPYSYSYHKKISADNAWVEGGTLYRVGLQEWQNNEYFNFKVNLCIIADENGQFIIAFDEKGKNLTADEANKLKTEYETPKADAPSNTEASGTQASSEGTKNPENTGDATGSGSTANTAAATTSASSSSGSSSNVGLIIGIVAAVVVVIVVVVIIVVKKKK